MAVQMAFLSSHPHTQGYGTEGTMVLGLHMLGWTWNGINQTETYAIQWPQEMSFSPLSSQSPGDYHLNQRTVEYKRDSSQMW